MENGLNYRKNFIEGLLVGAKFATIGGITFFAVTACQSYMSRTDHNVFRDSWQTATPWQ